MLRGARPNYVSQGNYHHLFAFAFPYPTAVSGVELTAPSAEVFKIPAEVSLFGETPDGEEVMLHDSFAHHLFTAGKALLPVAEPIPLRRLLMYVSSVCVCEG